MLIPDNIHPEQTIYFNGAFVLEVLQNKGSMQLLDLYEMTIAERKMGMAVFVLCLDWLYLLNLITLDENGTVGLCS
jgi:hypothetical protein